MVELGHTNVLFLPTVPAEANPKSSVVLHRSADTACLEHMNNMPTRCSTWPLTKQVCSNISEAYCGSLRSGGHSGVPIIRLAVTQT